MKLSPIGAQRTRGTQWLRGVSGVRGRRSGAAAPSVRSLVVAAAQSSDGDGEEPTGIIARRYAELMRQQAMQQQQQRGGDDGADESAAIEKARRRLMAPAPPSDAAELVEMLLDTEVEDLRWQLARCAAALDDAFCLRLAGELERERTTGSGRGFMGGPCPERIAELEALLDLVKAALSGDELEFLPP